MTTIPITAAPDYLDYPDANYCYKYTGPSIPDEYHYIKVSSNGLEIIAQVGNFVYSDFTANPSSVLQFPFTYNSEYIDTFELAGDPTEYSITRKYDGYGTLVTPFGTYTDVIRQRSDEDGYISYFWLHANPFFEIMGANEVEGSVVIFNPTTLNTSQFAADGQKISISPNPTQDVVFVDNFYGNPFYTLKLFSVNGQLLLEKKIVDAKDYFDLRAFPQGVYLLEVSDPNNKIMAVQKIVKK